MSMGFLKPTTQWMIVFIRGWRKRRPAGVRGSSASLLKDPILERGKIKWGGLISKQRMCKNASEFDFRLLRIRDKKEGRGPKLIENISGGIMRSEDGF